MQPFENYHSDMGIISVLAQQHKIAREHMYGKYATLVYGFILNITGANHIAGAIFREASGETGDHKHYPGFQPSFYNQLLQYTHQLAMKHLRLADMSDSAVPAADPRIQLLNLLCFMGGYQVCDTAA